MASLSSSSSEEEGGGGEQDTSTNDTPPVVNVVVQQTPASETSAELAVATTTAAAAATTTTGDSNSEGYLTPNDYYERLNVQDDDDDDDDDDNPTPITTHRTTTASTTTTTIMTTPSRRPQQQQQQQQHPLSPGAMMEDDELYQNMVVSDDDKDYYCHQEDDDDDDDGRSNDSDDAVAVLLHHHQQQQQQPSSSSPTATPQPIKEIQADITSTHAGGVTTPQDANENKITAVSESQEVGVGEEEEEEGYEGGDDEEDAYAPKRLWFKKSSTPGPTNRQIRKKTTASSPSPNLKPKKKKSAVPRLPDLQPFTTPKRKNAKSTVPKGGGGDNEPPPPPSSPPQTTASSMLAGFSTSMIPASPFQFRERFRGTVSHTANNNSTSRLTKQQQQQSTGSLDITTTTNPTDTTTTMTSGAGGGGLVGSSSSSSSHRKKARSDTLPFLRYVRSWGGTSSHTKGHAPHDHRGDEDEDEDDDDDEDEDGLLELSHAQSADAAFPHRHHDEGEVVDDDEVSDDHCVIKMDDDDDMSPDEDDEEGALPNAMRAPQDGDASDVEEDDDDEESWLTFGSDGNDLYHPFLYSEASSHYHLEWHNLPPIPSRFCRDDEQKDATTPAYLDSSLLPVGTLTEKEGNRFAMEQGVFLQAVMQLLAERDQVGIEGSIHSADNIWKKGPLKKLSFTGGRYKRPGSTKWKVKFVELRQGNICYYDDSGQGRKTIHLRRADTIVQESPTVTKGMTSGFAFEICVKGAPTRYWMASSEEEQQSWIRAIQGAMIGGEDTAPPRRELDLTPHQEALEAYKTLHEKVLVADTRELYIDAIQSAMEEANVLQVPVEWIRDQIDRETPTSPSGNDAVASLKQTRKSNIAPQKQIKLSIADFWKKMGQTTFCINGVNIPRDTELSSTRVVGALTRCILEHDKSFFGPDSQPSSTAGKMTELQAVSYARNILLTALRSKEQQYAWAAVHRLLENQDLVEITNKDDDEEYVVNIDVSFAGEECPDEYFLAPISDEVAGWLTIRRTKQPAKTGKKRYAVLSGSVFSYYEDESEDRPIGLRGQLLLSGGATLKQRTEDELEGDERYVLVVTTIQKEERVLSFDNEGDFEEWHEALQSAIDSYAVEESHVAADGADADEEIQTSSSHGRPKNLTTIRKSAERVAQGVTERVIKSADGSIRGGMRVIKGAKDGGIKAFRSATDGSMKVLRGAVGRFRSTNRSDNGGDYEVSSTTSSSGMQRRPSMQLLLNQTALSGKRDEPTVQCVFQATHNFWVSAKDVPKTDEPTTNVKPSDKETKDSSSPAAEQRWVSVSAKLFQAFLLMGGEGGRMAHGDALIDLDFAEADDPEATMNPIVSF